MDANQCQHIEDDEDDELLFPLTDEVILPDEWRRAERMRNHNWLAKYIVSTDSDIPEHVRHIARRVIEMHLEPSEQDRRDPDLSRETRGM